MKKIIKNENESVIHVLHLFFLTSFFYFETHKECLNNFVWPKIFTTNTLCLNVHIMYEFDKNQMPIAM
jgi:hypothetical protein